ncbi:hypothetical protein GCM10022224_045390 [Nonomuraea antimicrobica]|uniref:DUF2631 domain-containing protein n=1 Tax=Nonomuraea antimicrobica TaxID=561173 RepID=A0ABP7C3H4_9ACTN
MLFAMSEIGKSDEQKADTPRPATIRHVGSVAIVAGIALALIQVNVGGTRDASSLWVAIFIGVSLVGVGLRIEAAIRNHSGNQR